MFTTDEEISRIKDWYSNLVQGRGETSALLVAFAVGAFGILFMYTQDDIRRYSWAWFALTAAYWSIVVCTFLTLRAWAWHALLISYKTDEFSESMPKEIRDKLANERKKPLVRFAVADLSKRDGHTNFYLVGPAIALLAIAFFLWLTIGINMF